MQMQWPVPYSVNWEVAIMLNDITFGQFYPSNSFVHRMDARFKLVISLVFIVVLFMIKEYIGYAVAAIFIGVSIAAAKIPIKLLLKNLKPLWFILIFMLIINVLFTRDGNALVEFYFIKVTDEGIIRALVMMLRIIMLVMFTGLLTLTTSPISLTVGIESLLSPLKKIKFPAHELAMMMSIALRFIPTLMEEADKIMKAQMARGADFDTGNLYQKAKSMIPLLIPLVVSAFRRADELALAMTARCYNGGDGRTRMNPPKVTSLDYIALGVSLIFMALMVVFNYIHII